MENTRGLKLASQRCIQILQACKHESNTQVSLTSQELYESFNYEARSSISNE